MVAKRTTEDAPADAGAKRGNLEDALQGIRQRKLAEGSRGDVVEALEVHADLARMIESSNIPTPYRDWLVWMHDSIAQGMDARDACAVRTKQGRFSQFRRDYALWCAIDNLALSDGGSWQEAAKKLHEQPRVLARLQREYPDLELPLGRDHERASLETIKNIYRKMDKQAATARHD